MGHGLCQALVGGACLERVEACVGLFPTKFGGGGHLQASGCTINSLDDVKAVVKELNKVAKEYIKNDRV